MLWNINRELVLLIPLGRTPCPDRLIWHFDPRGMYTVKSGYRTALNFVNDVESSTPSSLAPWWKLLWHLPIAQKIKIFIWRCFHDIILTSVNLSSRKCAGDAAVGGGGRPGGGERPLSMRCAATVWKERGLGAIIRDSQGVALGAMAKKVPGFFSPFTAECLAIREGFQFAVDSGLRVKIVESDSIQAVKACNDPDPLAPVGPVFEDFSYLFRVLGGGYCCTISRWANIAAHTLARFSFAQMLSFIGWKRFLILSLILYWMI
ncbi:hypothetical protein TIFTF001_018610 [Ficus carica]|uniref:Uncharacterized protein n=1 Tax=Ficus carica TaxID=3494 RepID=A0AA88AEC2_FICCA|nr:hypothetical protein TIFTF001_018610 [Ficus carica]